MACKSKRWARDHLSKIVDRRQALLTHSQGGKFCPEESERKKKRKGNKEEREKKWVGMRTRQLPYRWSYESIFERWYICKDKIIRYFNRRRSFFFYDFSSEITKKEKHSNRPGGAPSVISLLLRWPNSKWTFCVCFIAHKSGNVKHQPLCTPLHILNPQGSPIPEVKAKTIRY